MSSQNSTYKLFNGTEWVEYYFKTSASQVGVTASRKFITSSVKVNDVAFTLGSGDVATVTIGGANIVGGASVASGSLTYITASDSVAAALGKLDQAAKAAYDNIPAGIVTTSNFSSNYGDLNAIEALSGTSGLLKKTAANTWTLDTTTYVPQARTINSKALSADITLYSGDIKIAANDNRTITQYIDEVYDGVIDYAEGKTVTYVISKTNSNTDSVNSQFNATEDEITITYTRGVANTQTRLYYSASSANQDAGYVDIKDLKIGDIINLTDTNLPDRWVSSVSVTGTSTSGTVTVKLRRAESYGMSFVALVDKPTTLAGYGLQNDAYISGQTVHLGSGSVTVPALTTSGSGNNGTSANAARADHTHDLSIASNSGTSALDLASNTKYQISAGGKTFIFKTPADNDTKNTAGGDDTSSKIFLLGLTAQTSSNGTGRSYTQDTAYVGIDGCLYSDNKRVISIVAGTTAPTNPKSGDIWIDTTA